MNRTTIIAAVTGVAAGVGLAWTTRSAVRALGPTPSGRKPAAAGELATERGSASDSPVGIKRFALELALPKGRTTYDTMKGSEGVEAPTDTVRDERWAVEMEAAIVQHSKAELADLMPDAEWLDATCMSQTCKIRIRAQAQSPEVMAILSIFLFGPGTARSHQGRVIDDRYTEYTFDVHYRDDDTRARISGGEYLARQRPLTPERQDLRDQVRDHFHNHPDDEH
ncbi:MAG: hypothetical protein IPL61_29505 [Myxococcales bacterium]|nr:hypothetical protein [Myxococcales bacterium]